MLLVLLITMVSFDWIKVECLMKIVQVVKLWHSNQLRLFLLAEVYRLDSNRFLPTFKQTAN